MAQFSLSDQEQAILDNPVPSLENDRAILKINREIPDTFPPSQDHQILSRRQTIIQGLNFINNTYPSFFTNQLSHDQQRNLDSLITLYNDIYLAWEVTEKRNPYQYQWEHLQEKETESNIQAQIEAIRQEIKDWVKTQKRPHLLPQAFKQFIINPDPKTLKKLLAQPKLAPDIRNILIKLQELASYKTAINIGLDKLYNQAYQEMLEERVKYQCCLFYLLENLEIFLYSPPSTNLGTLLKNPTLPSELKQNLEKLQNVVSNKTNNIIGLATMLLWEEMNHEMEKCLQDHYSAPNKAIIDYSQTQLINLQNLEKKRRKNDVFTPQAHTEQAEPLNQYFQDHGRPLLNAVLSLHLLIEAPKQDINEKEKINNYLQTHWQRFINAHITKIELSLHYRQQTRSSRKAHKYSSIQWINGIKYIGTPHAGSYTRAYPEEQQSD